MACQPFAALGGSFEFNGRLAATASLIYACIPQSAARLAPLLLSKSFKRHLYAVVCNGEREAINRFRRYERLRADMSLWGQQRHARVMMRRAFLNRCSEEHLATI
jgi:hypothetical protein